MEDLSYESLWQALYKERKTNELQPLPKTFYDDIKSYIENRGKSGKEGQQGDAVQNAFKLLEELFEKRKQKILIYIAHNKTLPEPVVPSERAFYERVQTDYRDASLDGPQNTIMQKESLYVNKDVPEILLPSGKKVGPYRKGDKIDIENDEDINFLKATEICVTRNE